LSPALFALGKSSFGFRRSQIFLPPLDDENFLGLIEVGSRPLVISNGVSNGAPPRFPLSFQFRAARFPIPARLAARFPKRLRNSLPILVILKDGAALIAPRHDMIRGSSIFEAQRSDHATILPLPRPKVNPDYQVPRPDPFIGIVNRHWG
jgi:hypothetical protein